MSLFFILILFVISIGIIIAALYVVFHICVYLFGSIILLFELISGKKSKEDWKKEMEEIKKRETLKKAYYAKKSAEKNKKHTITGTITFDNPIDSTLKEMGLD